MFYLLSSSLYGSNPYYDVMVEIFIIFFLQNTLFWFLGLLRTLVLIKLYFQIVCCETSCGNGKEI